MEYPSAKDVARCMDLRIRSKQGHPDTSKEARRFLLRMWKHYAEWYVSTDREVFYRSAPFGAQLPEQE